MTEVLETEFGPIVIHRRRGANQLSFRIGTNGQPRVTAPLGTSKTILKLFLRTSRDQIAQIINQYRAKNQYLPGATIGKTHLLKVEYDSRLLAPEVKLRPNFLVARLPFSQELTDETVQSIIRLQVQKILKKEARQILIPRLQFLAKQHGFIYQKAKISHASTRWGSCSPKGVISLNIGLVSLSNDLIDYVLIHELCHLRQMNHSPAFWAEVAAIMPNYKQFERELKNYSPHV